ncbi:MAG: tRNA (adenosine(37)-N6)-dimethylallyltransferase MiaA [Anaerolineae bacterium]
MPFVSRTDAELAESRIPLIAIVGPTAIGKTALGVDIAERFGGEIVSADSRQFYRMMDIGTAKPTPEELRHAPHHLIDIADPDETVGLARFLRLARTAIADIHARGKLPLLVGGTGQYVRALLRGWRVPEVPPDEALRAELEEQGERDPEGLWDRLMRIDPAAAEFIHPNNIRRVVRALEVSLKSGVPFSDLRRRIPPPYRVLKLGLTMDRAALYARADARVDAMMAAGLLQEVARLLQRGYDWDLPAMSGLGYGQFRPFFERKATLEEVVERIKLDTHDFIRRQYTWFRPSSPDIHWYAATDPHTPECARREVKAFLEAEGS